MATLQNPRQRKGLACSTAVSVAVLLSCLIPGFVPFAKAGSQPESNPAPAGIRAEFAIADFDGDSRPDLATVHGGQGGFGETRYFIHFRLTDGAPQTIGVTAPSGGLQLTSRDINGDSYPDLIVTTSWTNQPVAVLLNDGLGNFTQSDPSDFPGAFAASENFRVSKPDVIRDATAALFWRYLPGKCAECGGLASPLAIDRHRPTSAIDFASLARTESFLGRAPPSLLLYH